MIVFRPGHTTDWINMEDALKGKIEELVDIIADKVKTREEANVPMDDGYGDLRAELESLKAFEAPDIVKDCRVKVKYVPYLLYQETANAMRAPGAKVRAEAMATFVRESLAAFEGHSYEDGTPVKAEDVDTFEQCGMLQHVFDVCFYSQELRAKKKDC